MLQRMREFDLKAALKPLGRWLDRIFIDPQSDEGRVVLEEDRREETAERLAAQRAAAAAVAGSDGASGLAGTAARLRSRIIPSRPLHAANQTLRPARMFF